MSRKQLKTLAKEQLGNQLFGNNWLLALVVLLIGNGLLSAASFTFVGPMILVGPITFGIAKLFLKQTSDKKQMNIVGLFDGFTTDFAGNLVLGLLRELFVFLWSLLLIVPGIVKYYQYSMAFYIKADHPELDWRKCLDESKALTNGHKMELFILDLSFIGWYIVGALCLGVGTLWVNAYHAATVTQFYRALVPAPVVVGTADQV